MKGEKMVKIKTVHLVTLFLIISIVTPITTVYSEDYLVYDSSTNICAVHPTGVDDTENLREAFRLVIAGGAGGEVELVEGDYIISHNIIVVNFDGWFHGAGKEKTMIENVPTEVFPHYDLEHFPDLAGVFLFYQTDDVVKNLKFSDMTIKFHGQTYDYDGFTGVNVIDVCGKVNGNKEDFYETELHTLVENMHFEGEELDTWHGYNIISSFQVEGEPVVTDSWYFKPVSGTHVVRDCTFKKGGGGIGFRSMNGNVTVENNVIEEAVFAMINYDAGDYANEGIAIWRNNKIIGGIVDAFWLVSSENNLIENNVIQGYVAGNGLGVYGSDSNQIIGNRITECGGAGIHISEGSRNTVYDNYVHDNTVDLFWDGYGENLWICNDYETTGENKVTDTVFKELQELNTQLEQVEDDLDNTNNANHDLENEVEELESEISDINSQLTSANIRVETLHSQNDSMLSTTTAGIIAILAAVVCGAVGFYLGKK